MKQLFKLQQKIEKLKLQRDKARAELLKLRTIQATIEPSEEYEVKEMHIDCEKKDFEVGKWYKSSYGITARFTEKDFCNSGYISEVWYDIVGMRNFKNWQLATSEEIKEVLTNRCKELGLFGGEFDCLTNVWRSLSKDSRTKYRKNFDQLWINNKLAYEKGKFAKLIEKKRILTWGEAPKNIIKIVRNGLDERFHYSHTQLSDKSREYLSQFDNVVIE